MSKREPYEPYGKVKPYFQAPKGEPMYSYDTPAWSYWRGFAAGLRERGLTDKQITEELRSTGTRHFLDSASGEIEELARCHALSRYELCVTPKGTHPKVQIP